MPENIDLVNETLVNSTLYEAAKELEAEEFKLSSLSNVSVDSNSFEQVSSPSKQSSFNSWEKETFAIGTATVPPSRSEQDEIVEDLIENDDKCVDHKINQNQDNIVKNLKPVHQKLLPERFVVFKSFYRNQDSEEPYDLPLDPDSLNDPDENVSTNIEKLPKTKSLVENLISILNLDLMTSYLSVLTIISVSSYLLYDPTIIAISFSFSFGVLKWMTSHLVKFVILHSIMNFVVVRLFPVI